MNKETLLKYEGKVAKLFINSRKNNRVAGAYLLYGDRNAPLKETAIYLAKSLNCEMDVLACDHCDSCNRFNNGVRPDFVLIDGKNTTIKKENIQDLEKKFSLSAFEKNHHLSYVINAIDNITEEAANSLLKFLEEPKEGQVAFLTTSNINKVLPTIVSRSLTVRIETIDPDGFMNELINETFIDENAKKKKEIHLTAGEAYILSRLYSDMDDVKELLTSDSSFQTGYAAAEEFLNELVTDYRHACFSLLRQINQIKDSKCYNWMYLTLDKVYTSAIVSENDENNPLNSIVQSLSRNKERIEKAEEVIKDAISRKQVNLNPTLTCSRMLAALNEGKRQ